MELGGKKWLFSIGNWAVSAPRKNKENTLGQYGNSVERQHQSDRKASKSSHSK